MARSRPRTCVRRCDRKCQRQFPARIRHLERLRHRLRAPPGGQIETQIARRSGDVRFYRNLDLLRFIAGKQLGGFRQVHRHRGHNHQRPR
jgi:hypothetical protein